MSIERSYYPRQTDNEYNGQNYQTRSSLDYNPRQSRGPFYSNSPKEFTNSTSENRFYPASLHSSERAEQEIKSNYDRALRTSNERLSIQDIQQRRSLDILRANIKDLEHQGQNNEENHEIEKSRLKREYDIKIENLIRDLDEQTRLKTIKLHDIDYTIEREQKAWEMQKREMSIHSQKLNEEIEDLNSRTIRNNEEISYIKKQIETTQNEAHGLEREKKFAIERHENNKNNAIERHQRGIRDMNIKISEYEERIRGLEIEIDSTRKQIIHESQNAALNIRDLEDKLETSRNTLRVQMQDIARLKSSRDEAKTECQILSNEASMMEFQISKTQRENVSLREEIARLERLVYGNKGSPKKGN